MRAETAWTVCHPRDIELHGDQVDAFIAEAISRTPPPFDKWCRAAKRQHPPASLLRNGGALRRISLTPLEAWKLRGPVPS